MSEPPVSPLAEAQEERMRQRLKRGRELRKELNLPRPNPLNPEDGERQNAMISRMIDQEEREGKLK